MRIFGQITRKHRVDRFTKKFGEEYRAGLIEGLTDSVFSLQKQVVMDIREKSAGRVYKNGAVSHQASKPGDAPNWDTGQLAQSYVSGTEINKSRLEGKVGSHLKKSVWLEFGTRHIAARPHLGPALEKVRDKVAKFYIAAIRKHRAG